MKIRSVLVLGMLACASLACSGIPGMPGGMPTASVTEPWSSLNLPTDGGNVVFSDATTLSVMYDGNKVKELAPKYKEAIEKAGYKKVVDADMGDTYSMVYENGGKKCSGALTFANGQTIAGFSMQ